MNSNGVKNSPQVIFYVTLLEVILRGLSIIIVIVLFRRCHSSFFWATPYIQSQYQTTWLPPSESLLIYRVVQNTVNC